MTLPDITPLTDTELDELRVAVLTEQERRQIVATAGRAAAEISARFEQAVSTSEPVPWGKVPDAIGPGVRVVWTDGQTWRNKSGAWLPKTAHPGAYPLGWTQETGLPPAIPAWSATGVYVAGDLVTYGGKTYRCLQGHTANVSWTPTAAVSLWTLA